VGGSDTTGNGAGATDQAIVTSVLQSVYGSSPLMPTLALGARAMVGRRTLGANR